MPKGSSGNGVGVAICHTSSSGVTTCIGGSTSGGGTVGVGVSIPFGK